MKIKVFGRYKTCQLPHIFNTLCHDFQCNIVQTASVKNSSKVGFVPMLLQVYKYFFCSKTDRQSLLWVEFSICVGINGIIERVK